VSLEDNKVPYDVCNQANKGYCMLGASQRCQSEESIRGMGVQTAFDKKCYFCSFLSTTGDLSVFGPSRKSPKEQWRPIPECNVPTRINSGIVTTPTQWPWYNYNLPEQGIPDEANTDYGPRFGVPIPPYIRYPGGGTNYTLCWNLPADWRITSSVYATNWTLAVTYLLLVVTGTISTVSCFLFQDTFQTDWSKLSLCMRVFGGMFRVVIPVQRVLHMILVVPLSLDMIWFLLLGACSSVTDAYDRRIFYPLMVTWLILFGFFYAVTCIGSRIFREKITMETPFYHAPVAEVIKGDRRCRETCMFYVKRMWAWLWKFGP